jgi:hypothetical protein
MSMALSGQNRITKLKQQCGIVYDISWQAFYTLSQGAIEMSLQI